MRILFLNTLYKPDIAGGAEIMLHSIAMGLAKRGHDVGAIVLWNGNHIEKTSIDEITVFRIPSKNIYWQFDSTEKSVWKRLVWHAIDIYNPLTANPVLSIAKEFKPDIISCHNMQGLSSATWERLFKLKIPVFQVLHDYYNLCPKVTMYKQGSNCKSRCTLCRSMRIPHQRLSNRLAGVVAVSKFVLDTHTNYGFFTGVPIKRVIYNARKIPIETEIIKLNNVITFGFIGGLTPVKGAQELIDSFRKVTHRTSTPIRLLIAGEGRREFTEKLRKAAEGMNVEFLGKVNPSEFFPKLDVAIVPSLWNEPLAGVVIEALQFSLPTIGAMRGGIPEMITHDYNGLLFDPSDPDGLENAIFRMVAEKYLISKLGVNSRSSVTKFIDEDRMLDEYEDFAKQLTASA